MSTETIFYVILAIFLSETLLTKFLAYLNTTRWSDKLPEELAGIYDSKKYEKSQKYERTKYKFGWISSGVTFIIMLLVLIFGGFGALDTFWRIYTDNPILLALAFFASISVLSTIIGLPFSYYSTFAY